MRAVALGLLLVVPAALAQQPPPVFLVCTFSSATWGEFERTFVIDEKHSLVDGAAADITPETIHFVTTQGKNAGQFDVSISRLSGRAIGKFLNLGSPQYAGPCERVTRRKF